MRHFSLCPSTKSGQKQPGNIFEKLLHRKTFDNYNHIIIFLYLCIAKPFYIFSIIGNSHIVAASLLYTSDGCVEWFSDLGGSHFFVASLATMINYKDILLSAVGSGSALKLTEQDAISLYGKRIATLFFYEDETPGYSEFIVGSIVEKVWLPGLETTVKELLDIQGNTTLFRLHYLLGKTYFSHSSKLLPVYYIVL